MKPTRTYTRHGLTAPMARVKLRGLGVVDRRTAAARSLLAFEAQLEADLGGKLTAQQRTLVEIAARTRLLLEHVDAWLLDQRTVVNARRRSLLPIMGQRQALADSLARVLGQLGLDGQATPAPSLSDVLGRKVSA